MKTAEKISDITAQLIESIELQQQQLDKNELLDELRRKALEEFKQRGVPGKKSEAYKYSNPEKLFKSELQFVSSGNALAATITLKKYLLPELDAHVIVSINGVFNKESSVLTQIPKGVIISSLKDAIVNKPDLIKKYLDKSISANKDAFSALNSSLIADGLFIHVLQNTIVEKPIHIINITSAKEKSIINPHNLFIVETNAAATIVETQNDNTATSDSVCNNQSTIIVNENAAANYYIIQDENEINRINITNVEQASNSYFDTCTITLNSNWTRNNLNISLNGKNCVTHLNGLFVLNGKQHLDNQTKVDHRMPHCESNQLYKGILSDSSTGVFNGKIFVHRDAQKTNAYQSSKNILLSDNATINAKPELEIYADDVKCSHGSSTGKIDEEALFYLRSRGIGEESARTIMLGAFAGDVIEKIKNESLKNYISDLIEKKLNNKTME